jgi:hypothetical protein
MPRLPPPSNLPSSSRLTHAAPAADSGQHVDVPDAAPYAGGVSASDPCREAEELVELHRADTARLREARRRLADLTQELEADLPLRDRTKLAEAKAEAQERYHRAMDEAATPDAIQRAAAEWLNDVTRLNRAAATARHGGGDLATELSRLELSVRRLEVEVDASRIRAEAARDRCNEVRRAVATAAELEDARAGSVARLTETRVGGEPAVASLLRGDRAVLQQVSQRLSEETGREAGRLQLLLIELCEQVAASALDAAMISFPANHHFWRQFERDEAQRVATTLAQLGYRFDGRGGWLDGRIPHTRQLAIALAHTGLDGHVRRPLTQAQIDQLWQGAELEATHHLALAAPDLSLDQVQALLGVRAAPLDELWDNWAHVRRFLLSPG